MRWRSLLGMGLGALGPLAACSLVNGLRWGDWSPVSYGRSILRVWLDVVLGLGAAAAAVVALQFRDRLAFLRQRRALLAVAVLMLASVLLLPRARELGIATLRGLWTLVVDLSALPLDRAGPGMSRSADGAVLYYGTVKKALLQSCPYLTVLLALAAAALESPRERKVLALLLAAPALVAIFYARTSWHGGLAFNMRYFLLGLPCLTILAGYAVSRLAEGDGRVQAGVGALLAALVLLGTVLLTPWRFDADRGFVWFSRAPLLLSLLIGLSALAWQLRPSRPTARICSALACLGAAFAASAALAYDTPRTQGVRTVNYALATMIGASIEDDSLVFAQYPDQFYALIESRDRIRLAIPAHDQYRDMTRLADFHLAQGRPVYAVLETSLWGQLDKAPMSRRYRMQALVQAGPYLLRRLWPPQTGTAPSASVR